MTANAFITTSDYLCTTFPGMTLQSDALRLTRRQSVRKNEQWWEWILPWKKKQLSWNVATDAIKRCLKNLGQNGWIRVSSCCWFNSKTAHLKPYMHRISNRKGCHSLTGLTYLLVLAYYCCFAHKPTKQPEKWRFLDICWKLGYSCGKAAGWLAVLKLYERTTKKLLLLQPREAMVGSFRQAQPSKALRGENIFLNSIWQRRLSRVFNNTALHAFHITRQNISGEYTGAPTLSFPRTINSEHEFFCHCF